MYHVSPECDCEFQLKIPHRLFLYSFENAYFCLFKYKWAAAPAAPAPPPPPPPPEGNAFTARISDTLLKTMVLFLIIMSIALKTCILKPYQFNLMIYGFLSTHILN